MLSLHDLATSTRGFRGFRWEHFTRAIVFKTFFCNPDRDFIVTPQNILENGTIEEKFPLDAIFDCPLFPTPYKRNLYRLYVTIAYVTKGIQLGIPFDHMSKLRAIRYGHTQIINTYFNSERDRNIAIALNDIYSVLNTDVISPPVSTNDVLPLATDII